VLSKLLSQYERDVDGDQGDKTIKQRTSGAQAVPMSGPVVEADKPVCQNMQKFCMRLHFTTPASGLDAVA
jgi:hypothetical protein